MTYDPRHLRSLDAQRLYPSAAPSGALHRRWDVNVTAAGAEGDEWTVEFNGQVSAPFTSLAGPTTSTVAAGLRLVAADLLGVTVTGATTHLIVAVPAPNGPEDQPAAAPVVATDGAGTVAAADPDETVDAVGFGVTSIDQK